MTAQSDREPGWAQMDWRGALTLINGRTIKGYATGALGARLEALTLQFEDDSSMMLVSRSHPAGPWIEVEHREAPIPEGMCGRTLVGRGTDTWDPVCTLPSGHSGMCQEER